MKNRLYVVIISVLLITILGAYDNVNNQSKGQLGETTLPQVKSNIKELQVEDENVQSKLVALNENLSTESPLNQDILTQSSPKELLLGKWYGLDLYDFSYEFREDGTLTVEQISFGNKFNYTWDIIDDNTLNLISLDTNKPPHELHFEFIDGNVKLGTRPQDIYTRTQQFDEEGLLQESQEAALKQRFLGEWYFYDYIWNFYDDGTGVIDVAEANITEFSYYVIENNIGMDATISFTFPNGDYIFHAIFDNDSVTLKSVVQGGDTITLTRALSINNYSTTEQILKASPVDDTTHQITEANPINVTTPQIAEVSRKGNILLYALFITLTFLLSLVSPLLIGKQIDDFEPSNIFSCGVKILYSLFKSLSSIFEYVYKHIGYILHTISKGKLICREANIINLIRTILSIGVITLLYYILSYIIIGEMFTNINDLIINNISNNEFNFKWILAFLIDNIKLIPSILTIKGMLFRLPLEIVLSICYLSTIYGGLQLVNQIENVDITKRVFCKFSLLKSVTVINIIIIYLFVLSICFICSLFNSVDKITLVLLVLNIFNIEISAGTALVVVTPIVAEKVYQRYHPHELRRSHLFSDDRHRR